MFFSLRNNFSRRKILSFQRILLENSTRLLPSGKRYSNIYIGNRRRCAIIDAFFQQFSDFEHSLVSLFVARSDTRKNSPSRVRGVWSLRDQAARQSRVFHGTASRKRWGCKLLTSRLIYEIVLQKRHADCLPNSYMFYPRPFSLSLSLSFSSTTNSTFITPHAELTRLSSRCPPHISISPWGVRENSIGIACPFSMNVSRTSFAGKF